MAVFSREELKELIETPAQTAVSIYMPTHPLEDTPEDSIRLKNLLREAQRKLVEGGLRAPEARDIVKPAEPLLADALFWQHQSGGLAIFAAPGFYCQYRLPYRFPDLVIVGPRFHVKPLLSLLGTGGLFYVLAASQRRVRVLQCTSENCRDVTPEKVPVDLGEAMKFDFPEKQLQFHTIGAAVGRVRDSIIHGAGPAKTDTKDQILRYFQQINHGLRDLLHAERSPLVFAGVDFLHSIFRKTTDYKYVLPETIPGNPDEISEEALRKQAWAIAQPYFERNRAEALSGYCEAASKGFATNDLERALAAAYVGRVVALFVSLGGQVWGNFVPQEMRTEIHRTEQTGDLDLLDLVSVYTLLNGGAVYPVPPEQVPGTPPLAALFRY